LHTDCRFGDIIHLNRSIKETIKKALEIHEKK